MYCLQYVKVVFNWVNKESQMPTANGTSRLDVASPGVNFLLKSDTAAALFKKISTPSDRHRGMTFRPPWAFCVLGLYRKNEL